MIDAGRRPVFVLPEGQHPHLNRVHNLIKAIILPGEANAR